MYSQIKLTSSSPSKRATEPLSPPGGLHTTQGSWHGPEHAHICSRCPPWPSKKSPNISIKQVQRRILLFFLIFSNIAVCSIIHTSHPSKLQTYSSRISTAFLRFRACCLVIGQAKHNTTEHMCHEQQQEVPCKQTQMTAMMFVLDSPSMRTSNPSVSVTRCYDSRNISLEVTDYTVSWVKLRFKPSQLKSQKSD
jgi:hypothetical protein